MKSLLCKACNNDVHAWEDRLSDVLWAYRISVSSVTHFSPYFLLYGRLPRVPLSRTLPVQSTNLFERVTLSSRFDPLWLITRLRGSTVWLHQQDTGQVRKVHRSKVRLADPTLAWDEITVRPRRKQAPQKRVRTRVLENDEIVIRDDKQRNTSR